MFDIKCFYLNLKEKFLVKALEFARKQVAIKTKEIKSYFTLLINNREPLVGNNTIISILQ